MPVSSFTSRGAGASGFSPGSTSPLGRASTARVRLRGDLAGFEFSFCGSIRATFHTPSICRSTTPPAEISRAIAHKVSGIFEKRSFLLDAPPRPLDMPGLGVRLPNAKAQSDFTVELGVRQIKVATGIEAIHQSLVRLISRAQSEADQVELGGRGQLETRIGAHPFDQLLGKPYVLADVLLQAFDSVVPDHKPQFERAEPAPELNVPVAIIDDRARFCGLVSQVFRQHRERLDEMLA